MLPTILLYAAAEGHQKEEEVLGTFQTPQPKMLQKASKKILYEMCVKVFA